MAVGSMMMTFLLALEGGLHNTMYFVLPGLLVFGIMMHYMPEYKRVNIEHSLKQAVNKVKKQNRIRAALFPNIKSDRKADRRWKHSGIGLQLSLVFCPSFPGGSLPRPVRKV